MTVNSVLFVGDDLSDIKDVNYDVLVFFSPIDIVSLFKNFPDFEQKNKLIAGFGTSTAKAIRLAGLKLNIKAPTKESITIRLDAAVVDFFKSHGKGWQVKINDALLDFVNSH